MKGVRSVHFVGIGGSGMSGIAEILLSLGYRVSGSDLQDTEVTARLRDLGAIVHRGHREENVADADVVVISSAVIGSNSEVAAARRRSIPVIPRAEMLAELGRLKYGIAVAGSHGKTTTTSLIGHVLTQAALDPTIVVGGRVRAFGSGARVGRGEYLVAEADESDGSFLKLAPTIAVVTNIDPEHLDHYGSFEALERTFVEFLMRIPFYGLAVLCADHPGVLSITRNIERRHVTYGLTPEADYSARNVKFSGLAMTFELVHGGRSLGEGHLQMPGVHNVQNALAAIAVAHELEVDPTAALRMLSSFEGVDRRFSLRGEAGGVLVVDDYGHHPAEIRATLNAARDALGRRIIVVFQPHRYTRTRDLMGEFSSAFALADTVVVTPIYPAGESPIEGVDHGKLAAAIRRSGHPRVVTVAREEVLSWLLGVVQAGDVVLTLGAGDVTALGTELLTALTGTQHGHKYA